MTLTIVIPQVGMNVIFTAIIGTIGMTIYRYFRDDRKVQKLFAELKGRICYNSICKSIIAKRNPTDKDKKYENESIWVNKQDRQVWLFNNGIWMELKTASDLFDASIGLTKKETNGTKDS